MLKIYIKTHLKTRFTLLLKLPAEVSVLFYKKFNGSLQLYINYWWLNNLTIENKYSFSLINKSLNRLDLARYFTQLNLASAYYQIKVKKRNKWKTAFKTRYKYFKYQVIPFWLSNALISFQPFINKVFAKKLDIFVIVCLNNILIYPKN